MALVFQYGSNLSSARLNHSDRLGGDARVVGKAVTKDEFAFTFDIVSKGRAASDIVAGRGRKIWGVIYDIPDYLIHRETAKARQRKSLDGIEGEGKNYERVAIRLNWPDGSAVAEPVITYIGKKRVENIKTTQEYVDHILAGLAEHKIQAEYVSYVTVQILANNPQLNVKPHS
jgi:cation transport regulator ChaC